MAIQFNFWWSYISGNAGLPRGSLAGTEIPNVTSSYAHGGLQTGVTHYYVVVAYDTDSSLYSLASNELSGTPGNIEAFFGSITW